MPGGIPVATVAVNGAKNAGLLALRILALENETTALWLDKYMKTMETTVEDKAAKLETTPLSTILGS